MVYADSMLFMQPMCKFDAVYALFDEDFCNCFMLNLCDIYAVFMESYAFFVQVFF
jgi:hypothetical protein